MKNSSSPCSLLAWSHLGRYLFLHYCQREYLGNRVIASPKPGEWRGSSSVCLWEQGVCTRPPEWSLTAHSCQIRSVQICVEIGHSLGPALCATVHRQPQEGITVIFSVLCHYWKHLNKNWSSLGTTLSNLQQMTSNPGAMCPEAAVYTPRNVFWKL